MFQCQSLFLCFTSSTSLNNQMCRYCASLKGPCCEWQSETRCLSLRLPSFSTIGKVLLLLGKPEHILQGQSAQEPSHPMGPNSGPLWARRPTPSQVRFQTQGENTRMPLLQGGGLLLIGVSSGGMGGNSLFWAVTRWMCWGPWRRDPWTKSAIRLNDLWGSFPLQDSHNAQRLYQTLRAPASWLSAPG